jgi:2-keto-4-pentenoate hydratase/2-oxohepta-3-ene-1,7-dioic acid hydratase in catechol pathway
LIEESAQGFIGPMRLFSLRANGAPVVAVAVEKSGGGFRDLTAALAQRGVGVEDGLLGLIRASEPVRAECLSLARQAVSGEGDFPRLAESEVRVLAPVRRPDKIVCVGRNYREHCSEQGAEAPSSPILFAKWPRSIIGPGEAIERPSFTSKLDYEGEIVVVIGRGGKNIPRDRALEHVFGYSAANDVSARDLQKSDGQWLRAKSCDTFCPLGPCVATADAFPDPSAIRVRTWVNGQQRQEAPASDMIFAIPVLIEFISAAFRLEPGDLILTGTPPGVGAYREPREFLEPGHVVRVEVEGVGALENPVALATSG